VWWHLELASITPLRCFDLWAEKSEGRAIVEEVVAGTPEEGRGWLRGCGDATLSG